MAFTKKEFCVVIPAIKKNAKIPDQLIKKMNGVSLIQRTLNIAKKLVSDSDIFVVTDSEEITLICERNGVKCFYDKDLKLDPSDVLNNLKDFYVSKTNVYENIILYRANTPLVDENDILSAYDKFTEDQSDILITIKKEHHNLWKGQPESFESLFKDTNGSEVHVDLRAFVISRSNIFALEKGEYVVTSFHLNDNTIEIVTHQDWWICEKLLKRKRILFVVAGFPEIGMGHVYRGLSLAHEINDHEIIFVCTSESELAIKNIAEKEYTTLLQEGPLIDEVLNLKPDLVINDMLNTDQEYITALKAEGIAIVNFEDLGTGANVSDITINELYDSPIIDGDNICWGRDYLFLRDEFQDAIVRSFSLEVKSVLLSFGGTDPNNYTETILDLIAPICAQQNIKIFIVNGPGYEHSESIQTKIEALTQNTIDYTSQTSIISGIMEKVDMAIVSNGRTVYELAHMKVPSIVVSHHAREEGHQFAIASNGFVRIGILDSNEKSERLLSKFEKFVYESNFRKQLFNNMHQHDFLKNKSRVIRQILSLLKSKT